MNYFHKLQISLFLCFVICLPGCIDLSRAKLIPEKKVTYYSHQPAQNKDKNSSFKSKSRGEIHSMLGGLGMFSVGMSEVRNDIAKQYKNISASSNMWYNAGDVTHSIIHYYYTHEKHRPIILIGHSLGANEQIKVARNLKAAGIPVDLLVTVDAVSQTIVPSNVKHVLNVYKPGYIPMFSGLRLRAVDPHATLIENINVNDLKGINVNHFTIDKNKIVQAMILDQVKKVLTDDNKSA